MKSRLIQLDEQTLLALNRAAAPSKRKRSGFIRQAIRKVVRNAEPATPEPSTIVSCLLGLAFLVRVIASKKRPGRQCFKELQSQLRIKIIQVECDESISIVVLARIYGFYVVVRTMQDFPFLLSD